MKLKKFTFLFILAAVMAFIPQFSFAEAEQKAVVVNPTDIRVTGEADSLVISKLAKGQEVLILEASGDWAKVKLDNGIEGYLSNLDIEMKEEQTMSVMAMGVNVRAFADAESLSIGIVNTGDIVKVLGTDGDWAEISTDEVQGYVLRQYLTTEAEAQAVSRGASREAGPLLDYAKTLLGRPYVYGSRGPNSFDCSGFVSYVYQNAAGIKLPRVSRDQARYGTPVSRDALLPGDIIAFDTNGGRNGVNHVGIYLGEGKFIHASSARIMSVTIDSLDSKHYSSSYMSATRVLP